LSPVKSDSSGYFEDDLNALSGIRDSARSECFEGPIHTVEKEPVIYEVFQGEAAEPVENIEEVEEGWAEFHDSLK
jgi:hypothetical protein